MDSSLILFHSAKAGWSKINKFTIFVTRENPGPKVIKKEKLGGFSDG
jgi:hypothetical protein